MDINEFSKHIGSNSIIDAVYTARDMGYRLHKYADPIEGEELDICVEYACEVATEDSSLIWLEPRAQA